MVPKNRSGTGPCFETIHESRGNAMTDDVTRLRRDLAAAFRLAAKFDFNEGICNHFSVQVSASPERYLINPYGVHWLEMRPEDLLLIDGSGAVLEGEGEVESTA